MCRVCVCTRMMYTKGPLMRFINKLGIVNPGIRRKGKNTNRPGQYIITLPIYKGETKVTFLERHSDFPDSVSRILYKCTRTFGSVVSEDNGIRYLPIRWTIVTEFKDIHIMGSYYYDPKVAHTATIRVMYWPRTQINFYLLRGFRIRFYYPNINTTIHRQQYDDDDDDDHHHHHHHHHS